MEKNSKPEVLITENELLQKVHERKSLGFTGGGLNKEVLDDLIFDKLLANTYSEIGIVVTDQEFQEIIFGDIISGYMYRAFYNSAISKKVWLDNFRQMLTTEKGKQNFILYKELITLKRKRKIQYSY